ncbi:MAG: hypothetical protein OXG88_01115 [Gammaproteobacteria bacterium]|nr:hypothetical protein [Gammaproteobacteria bacterium]
MLQSRFDQQDGLFALNQEFFLCSVMSRNSHSSEMNVSVHRTEVISAPLRHRKFIKSPVALHGRVEVV